MKFTDLQGVGVVSPLELFAVGFAEAGKRSDLAIASQRLLRGLSRKLELDTRIHEARPTQFRTPDSACRQGHII